MAISTPNDSYSVARKQVDELLHRSFHINQHHHVHQDNAYSQSGPSSTASNSSSSTINSSSDLHFQQQQNQHQNQHASSQEREPPQELRFVSPALCSTSASFFDSSSASSRNTNTTAKDDAKNATNTKATNTRPQAEPELQLQNIQTTLQSHLRAIELDHNLHISTSRILNTNVHANANTPFWTSAIRRGGTGTGSAESSTSDKNRRKGKNEDLQTTVLKLAQIVFQQQQQQNGEQQQSQNEQNDEQGEDSQEEGWNKAKHMFQTYGSTLPKKVCQHPFKRNDIVWVCRTCQADETCVLCHTCYDNSNHEGHDVAFYHAQAGGCCDCGDPQAWDPKGFCPHHGKEVRVLMEEGLEGRIRGVVDGCVDFIKGVAEGVEMGWRRANGGVGGVGYGGVGGRGGKRKFALGRSQSLVTSSDGGTSGTGGSGMAENRSFQRSNTYALDEMNDISANVNANGNDNDEHDHGIFGSERDLSLESMHVSNHQNQSMENIAMLERDVELENMSWSEIGIEDQNQFQDQQQPHNDDDNNDDNGDDDGDDGNITNGEQMQEVSMTSECQFDPRAASTSKSRSLNNSSHHSTDSMDESLLHSTTRTATATATATATTTEMFNPEAASTSKSKSQSRIEKRIMPENLTPAQYLGLLGSQEEGLFLLLHADDVHKSMDVAAALRMLYDSHPRHGNFSNLDSICSKIATLFLEDIGDLIVWGTEELMEELGPVLSACWKDGDALACTRFGALILEKAKLLTGGGMVVSIKTRWELCRELRCSAILEFLNLMSDSCDPLCRLVSVGLGAKDDTTNTTAGLKEDDGNVKMNDDSRVELANHPNHLSIMLQNDLKLPRKIAKSWHDLLLTLLAVPNFKAALANAYVDTYAAVTSEYARGIGIFEKSSYTLSVQFLNRVTYVEDLVRERDLLGCLVRSLFRTMSVASKTNADFANDAIMERYNSSHSPSWTINMIHHVIDDFQNPLGPRTPPQWRSIFGRDEEWEDQIVPDHVTATRLNAALDPLHPVLSHRRYGPCVSDLKCVLNVPGVSRLFSSLPNTKVEKDNQPIPLLKPCLLDAWINLLYICQNMDRQRWRREEEGHVEQEPRDWVGAFNADIAIGSLFERLLSWEGKEYLRCYLAF